MVQLFINRFIWRFRPSKGQTMTEYALILAGVAVVALVAYNALGTKISSYVNVISGDL